MSVNYVYALVDRPAPGVQRGRPGRSRSIRVAGRRIELVAVGPVWAAIEELERPPELSEASLRSQHDVAVALARRFDAILPARFGAALDTPELERLVKARRRRIERAFDTVRGRAQMTVRLFEPEAPGPGSARRPQTGTLYLQSRKKSARPLPTSGAAVRRAVRPLVERERVDAGRGRVRATLHHLIERSRAAEYKSLVRRAIETTSPFEDEVVVSGPWPPFAFAPVLSP